MGRDVIVRRNHLVRLLGLIPCVAGAIGHVSKVLLTGVEVRWTRAFWVGVSPARGVEEVIRKKQGKTGET